ncbi:MAG: transporter substrate-binding domain-containing protein [Clostridia bacterium]|nr:transporter substrate-binding domain-containing protein [Clostridia bacterium]
MKKLFLVLAALITAAGMAQAETAAPQEIVAAAENPALLCEYEEDAGALALFNRKAVQAVAEHLGAQAVFAEAGEGEALEGLAQGRYDLVLGAVPQEEEAERFAFSAPYAYNRQTVIVRGDADEGFETDGHTQALADTAEEQLEQLVSGRADYMIWDVFSALAYLDEHPLADIAVASYLDEAEPVSFLLSGEKEEQRAAVDEALAVLMEDGTMAGLSLECLGYDASVAPQTQTEAEPDPEQTGEVLPQ